MSEEVQYNMTCHINAGHIMLLPYIYTLYINYLACVYLIYEYELRLGKDYQGRKSSACFISQLKYSDVENELKGPQRAKLECFRSSPGPLAEKLHNSVMTQISGPCLSPKYWRHW